MSGTMLRESRGISIVVSAVYDTNKFGVEFSRGSPDTEQFNDM